MTERTEPGTEELTHMVRASWQRVLGHEDFGLDSDFFAVGGNSLLVAKIMADLSRQLSTRLPMRLFFAGASVRGIGQSIAEYRGAVQC